MPYYYRAPQRKRRYSPEYYENIWIILLTGIIVGIGAYNAHYSRANYEVNKKRLDDHPTSF